MTQASPPPRSNRSFAGPSLRVESLEGRELPANLIPGGIVAGSINVAVEIDAWTFAAHAGDRIELISSSTPKQAGFKVYVDLYAPSGTRVTGFWPDGNVTLSLNETGVHKAMIRDDNHPRAGRT